MPISRILVANRGEIALRVFRTCRERGIACLAVHAADDAAALHVAAADAAFCLSGGYLDAAEIVRAAVEMKADAIHPGYGFLSENPGLVTACEAAGITWIGPGVEAIDVMGDKVRARAAMLEADVPVIPGFDDLRDAQQALARADELGFPVMLKASAGGGGKGMRRVIERELLPSAFEAAAREAEKAFGDRRVFIERAIDGGRHIEIQIMADGHGNVAAFPERDCSIQRRHQKVIEEAPSPAPCMSPELRREMGDVARRVARAVDYRGAGTVEFLVEETPRGPEFYFLEMNTRLQVEHPVTEAISGRDLVADQIDVASGHELAYARQEVEFFGHAVECRIYAEDPVRFLPSPGRVERLRWPSGPGIRVDAALAEGYRVSDRYDPMIAKLVAFGSTRAQAVGRMRAALAETVIMGIETNLAFHRAVFDESDFVTGVYDTGYIAGHPSTTTGWQPDEIESRALAAAVVAQVEQNNALAGAARGLSSQGRDQAPGASAWSQAVRWRR